MRASAIAHPNIALVKYWGKRDKGAMLPLTGSIGLTIDTLAAYTTVSFDPALGADKLILNGVAAAGDSAELCRVSDFLTLLRSTSGITARAHVVSCANFPLAAGLASSAAGFAALATAGAAAARLSLTDQELSMLARRGSGSACRAVLGGIVEWMRGESVDGNDSCAVQLASEECWPDLRIIVCSVTGGEKKCSSSAAMENARQTSPLFGYWLESAMEALPRMRTAVKERDFTLMGAVAEANCLQMHATVFTSSPAHSYWSQATGDLLQLIVAARRAGLECYFTVDAGPHVKILCRELNVEHVVQRIRSAPGLAALTVCAPGPRSSVVECHLCG